MKPAAPVITAAKAAALLSLSAILPHTAAAVSPGRNYVAEITPASGSTAEPSLGTPGRVTVRYVDGIGRAVAEVAVGEGGDGGDIAAVTEHDAAGRVCRQWAPVPTGGSGGDFPSGHATLATAFHGQGSRPFTETVYDMFRKDDPAETRLPGNGWDRHPARRQRAAYDPDDPRLRCLRLVADPDGPALRTNGYYPKGTLRVVSDIDGDGGETLTFTDRLGRAVLTRRRAPDGGWADTYRVYDRAGDLRHILSPAASLALRPRRPVPDSVLRKLAFYYEYDAAHRLILRRDPGVEPVYTVYDRLGNPVLSQDGCQRERGEWTVMKYDRKLRPAVAGTAVITSAPTSDGSGGAATLSVAGPIGGGVIGGGGTGPVTGEVETALRRLLAGAYADSLLTEEPILRGQLEYTLQYTSRSGPAGFIPHRAWHYDSYAVWDSVWSPDPAEARLSAGKFPPVGLPTAEMSLTGQWDRPHIRGFAYDHAGRLTATASRDVYSDTYSHSEKLTLDFNGLVTRREASARLMAEKTTLERHTAVWDNAYDRARRLTRSTLAVDGGEPVTVAANSYDPAGRPASTGIGGTASANPGGVVTASFAHDPAGRLLAVSSPLFSQRVWFGQAPPSIGGDDRWSGSPCADSTATALPGGGVSVRRLRYSFDSLDRLTAAVDAAGAGVFSESREFDINGNTLSLDRRLDGVTLQRFDAAYDGNAPLSLNDDSDGVLPPHTPSFPPGYYPPGSFARDAMGRATRDSTRSVVSVTYDPRCGLPSSVRTASGERVVSAYLPDGTLLSRELLTPRVTVTTTVNAKGDTVVRTRRDHIRDTEWRYGAFTHRRDTKGKYSWRVEHEGGVSVAAYGGVTHHFYLRDRLGSTRAVFGMDGAPVQSVGYFPGGSPVILGGSDRVTDRLHEGMPFIDHAGLGAYDNKARWLDATAGSFWQPDPMAGDYPDTSPYANRGCNPTRYLDPSGEEIVITYMNKTYKLWDNNGELFTPGGDGVSEPVPEEVNLIIMGIQAAYTYGSAEMVGNMINSDRTFTYKVGAADCGTFTVPDGKGGSISTIAQGKGIHKNDAIASVVHETMHNAQFMHDQGGPTTANEVEANVFTYTVSMNSMNSGKLPLFQTQLTKGEPFSEDVIQLSTYGYSTMTFINAANCFFDSNRNNANLYNHYKKTWHGLQLLSLLQKYRIHQFQND